MPKNPIYNPPCLPTKYPTQTFAVGDEVGYARYFLRQTGSVTDSRWHMRGKVVEVISDFVRVDWGDGSRDLVAACNVAKVGSVAWAD